MSRVTFQRPLTLGIAIITVFGILALSACGATPTPGGVEALSTPTVTSIPPTATPQPPCVQDVAGSKPFQGLSAVPGIQLPSGTYMSGPTTSGGGTGQYAITTYTLCFKGTESAIDGGSLSPSGTATSTIGHLAHNAWIVNNLFPDPTNDAYLDYCSTQHVCVNSSGSGAPFTFVGFDQYANAGSGYTTFRLQVATIAAPACANDPQYYSGSPKYTIYEDGSKASSSNPTYHFQMPPGTRVSTFQGGGAAGSTYAYFCSAGTQSSIITFLKQAMQNSGYSISNTTASGFSAAMGSGPTYNIDVSVPSHSNYYLRIFVPM
jgi:hypothetical protein